MKTLLLLALDESSLQQLISRALRAIDYDVVAVKEKEGLKKALQESRPALMLVGASFDGRKSVPLIEELLLEYPTLPIVFMATKDSPLLIQEVLRTGVSAYLTPPLKTDDIVAAIESSLKRARRIGDWVRREVKTSTSSLKKRVSELEVLLQIGKDITGSLHLDAVLNNVVRAAVELTNAEEGSLLLLDEKSKELYMRAGHNFEKGFVETFRLPVTDTLAGQVVQSGEPLLLNREDAQKINTAYLVQALIYVPLKVQEQIIGVLGVDNRQRRLPFSKRDILLISLLADYAAVAIENARLYEISEKERAKFEAVLSNMNHPLMIVDKRGYVELANAAMRAALGFDMSEASEKDIREITTEQDFISFIKNSEQGSKQYSEVTLNDDRVFSIQNTPIPGVGHAITMQDISDLKEINRLKDDFVHTVSHDLRSPLTAVLGYAELLERVGTINDQQREFVSRIRDSVQDITALIDDLLDLGRIEAGFDTYQETIRVDHLLRYILKNYDAQKTEKEQIVEVSIESDIPSIRGNPIRIKQLFDNLIGNAIKYTPAGKKISVKMRLEGTQIITEVKDEGPGIPAEDQPYIFEKFYRGNNISFNSPGTGLGLAIVKKIVESHNGRIWVESTLGQGSTFYVVLPS